ncbi:hypothetical protein Pint_20031 [Pistacia integerrima]|uniref:Uncharacterized protein n=1 Tax=Pistacia integerrima TaxID=434235 RepID=A0ACC0X820_9ROSI|nr:hypothetical protein Pint_20031 [Pistacia integerrima]
MSEQDEPPRAPTAAQSLNDLRAPLSSSLSNLSSSSRSLPSDKDFHFFNNFEEFNRPVLEIATKSQSLLHSIGSSEIWGRPIEFPDQEDIVDAYDWLVNVNDDVFERIDASFDEFEKNRGEKKGEGGNEDGFQLVYGKNKNKGEFAVSGGGDSVSRGKVQGDSLNVKVKEKKERAKVPFHIPTIKRPQEEYNILVNNLNQPFQHVWLQRSEDNQRFVHPLESLSVLDFVDKDIGDVEPVKPPSLEETPFKLVEEVKDLKELAAKLRSVNEFVVDLEHNQYRSFQGLTCLMQISTRTEDFVVDTLKLRIHVGPYLREIFKDPTKKKVMHGADRDIVWLQRDFGIYICNMFDTGQASRVLKLERNSLEYLLQHFCGVTANKEYQNADWRLRPLPDEMLRYAREDTHYLLYIYDMMKIKLFSMSKEAESSDASLIEVYKRSYDICMQLYEKELLTENSYLYIYGLQGTELNAQQLAIVAGLCQWRDVVARTEDESTGYILPNKTLLEIAKQMPVTPSKLRRLLKSKHPYIERNLGSVVSIIRDSLQNATAFEAIAQQLKEGRMEIASEVNLALNDETEALVGETSTNVKNSNVTIESVGGGNAFNASIIPPLPPSLKFGSSVTEPDRKGLGSLGHPGANGEEKESGIHISELPRESITNLCQSRETNTGISSSVKVTEASVQALKKPTRGFGALLGNPKRKFDPEKKDKEEIKLDQIRSSVNLPFHSFSARDEPKAVKEVKVEPVKSSKNLQSLSSFTSGEQPKPVAEESSRVLEVQSEEPPAEPSGRFNTEDVIMLEDDVNEEESTHDNLEKTNVPRENNSAEPALEMDEQDEPMSLSDLSTSFQECLQSVNKNRKPGKLEKSENHSGFLQIKPFDFEAARKQIKFGEAAKKESVRIEGNQKNPRDSGDKKKNLAGSEGQKDDETKELSQGKRRFAFPATGNRSATFR